LVTKYYLNSTQFYFDKFINTLSNASTANGDQISINQSGAPFNSLSSSERRSLAMITISGTGE